MWSSTCSHIYVLFLHSFSFPFLLLVWRIFSCVSVLSSLPAAQRKKELSHHVSEWNELRKDWLAECKRWQKMSSAGYDQHDMDTHFSSASSSSLPSPLSCSSYAELHHVLDQSIKLWEQCSDPLLPHVMHPQQQAHTSTSVPSYVTSIEDDRSSSVSSRQQALDGMIQLFRHHILSVFPHTQSAPVDVCDTVDETASSI